MRPWTAWCGLQLCALLGSHALAAAPGELQPVPELELGTHAAAVTDVTGSANVMLSVSLDKTLRLWRTDSGRLIRTVHVPADGFMGGQLDAVTLSRDERFALVGGYTRADPLAPESTGGFSLYVYDQIGRAHV